MYYIITEVGGGLAYSGLWGRSWPYDDISY